MTSVLFAMTDFLLAITELLSLQGVDLSGRSNLVFRFVLWDCFTLFAMTDFYLATTELLSLRGVDLSRRSNLVFRCSLGLLHFVRNDRLFARNDKRFVRNDKNILSYRIRKNQHRISPQHLSLRILNISISHISGNTIIFI